MDLPAGHVSQRPHPSVDVAAAVLDSRSTVLRWSGAAAALLGRTSDEVCGRPLHDLLIGAAEQLDTRPGMPGVPTSGLVGLRHRSGHTVEVTLRVLPLDDGSEFLLLATPTGASREREPNRDSAFVRALLAQDRIGVAFHDLNLRITHTNATFGPPLRPGSSLHDVMSPQDAREWEAALRLVLETGEPLVGREQRVRSSLAPGLQWMLSLSALRLEDPQGRPTGVATLFTDVTARRVDRPHQELRHDASVRIGDSLDVIRIVQELVDILVPALGDLAGVDLAEAILEGDEPPKSTGGGQLHLRRVAVAAASGNWPDSLLSVGEAVPLMPDIPDVRKRQRGEGLLVPDRATAVAILGDPDLVRAFVPEHGHSAVATPLFARGLLLGSVNVWRTEQVEPFTKEDLELLQEIVSRAAITVDNARRYIRERRAATALQQRLLPRPTRDTPAAETTGSYLPAGGGAGIGGDWFDVIPLPSLRVALVVGDVIGHGLHATATMGRLRTAVLTLAELELGPDELLTHVDDLVQQLVAEAKPQHQDSVGATCLYAIYDPATGRCEMASAGHPPPMLVRPDGTVEEIKVVPGPPLGVGGMPFEVTDLLLEADSVLALYTDGLTALGGRDIESGTQRLVDSLAARCGHTRAPSLDAITCDMLVDTADPPPRDDATLLLARLRVLPEGSTADWEFPGDPTVVADVRHAVARQLTAWGLDALAFTTELIVSELATNAIRYADGPFGVRLIHDEVLVCEVSDRGNAQPRLRRARTTDEGGRGLFLVAQLASRWGSRYRQSGKTVWAEQSLALPTE
ncbi:SpoIIE family protein phosphatase [Streptomyces sp. DSM 41524]|uniref:SpoIIE family protein phosphatase n=1 Tax=Streptomyces asiaticus subsp. ignotus TaxID=3098222 RepID=A0ABU7Q626_9ACTN|nr:SpoIIE family protein phosphatase [Streptomyces sp. DSM 41524]